MSIEKFGPAEVGAVDGLDELQKLIGRVEAGRPGVRERREDLKELHAILDELVAMRREADLSQTDVASYMGVKQPTVSQFETESSDPKVSTIQRYARAVGARLRLSVDRVTAWPAVDVCSPGPFGQGIVTINVIQVNTNRMARTWIDRGHPVVEPRTTHALMPPADAMPLAPLHGTSVELAPDDLRADYVYAV